MPISQQICLKPIYLCPREYYYNYSLCHDRCILLKYHTVTVFIQYTKTKNRRQCMHLQSYMYASTKLHVCIYKVTIEKIDRVCVRVCIRSSLHSVRFGKLLRCAHKRIVNYIERRNIQVELIRFRKKYRLFHVNFCEARYSTRLVCLRLDSRYNISMFDSNHFNYP